MKKIVPVILILLLSVAASAQTATRTSVADGMFTDVSTWDCNCIPADSDNIIVAHHVTFNTDFIISTGSITVNSNATLLRDNILDRHLWISDTGHLVNNGIFTVNFLLNTAGTLINNDSMQVTALTNISFFGNHGTINQIDSLWNLGNMTNAAAGKIICTHFLNEGICLNQGVLQPTYLLNMDTLNNMGNITTGSFENDGLANNDFNIYVTTNFFNTHHFHNNNAGLLHVTSNFLNADSIYLSCTFYNAGEVLVGANWMNYDTIKGPSTGHFCVHGYSWNKGQMLGTFDFCDLTPLLGFSPDYNTGNIAPTVTRCTFNCNSSMQENKTVTINIYPNPFTGSVNFDLGGMSTGPVTIVITDMQGRQILSCERQGNTIAGIDCRQLASGLYFCHVIHNGSTVYSGKLIKE